MESLTLLSKKLRRSRHESVHPRHSFVDIQSFGPSPTALAKVNHAGKENGESILGAQPTLNAGTEDFAFQCAMP